MSSYPGPDPEPTRSDNPDGEGIPPATEAPSPPPPPVGPPPPGAPPYGAPAQQGPYGPAPGQLGAPPPFAAGPGFPVDPAKARNTAMLAHLSAFVGLLGIPSLVGPLIVWLTQREQDPYIDDQAREALNFNISVAIYAVALFVFSFVTFGLGLILTLPALLALGIGWVVLVIIAAMKSNNGEPYRYPLTIRLVS